MPEPISQDLFTEFKKSLNHIFLSDYVDIKYSEDHILLFYPEYKFHASTAYKLNEICGKFDFFYWVLADPSVIKIKVVRNTFKQVQSDGNDKQ